MANKGIYSYTVQEGTNAGLGQGGSMLITGTTAYVAPAGQVFVSITIISDTAAFAKLTAADPEMYINTVQATHDSEGTALTEDEIFTGGITIYGRWTNIKMTADDIAIAYLGSE